MCHINLLGAKHNFSRQQSLIIFFIIFSSPEPKAPGELIVWAGSVVGRRPSTISNDFSSETTGPIVTKFHM